MAKGLPLKRLLEIPPAPLFWVTVVLLVPVLVSVPVRSKISKKPPTVVVIKIVYYSLEASVQRSAQGWLTSRVTASLQTRTSLSGVPSSLLLCLSCFSSALPR
jgi:hypothetical protein